MAKTIAIDIVLLPPKNIDSWARELSLELNRNITPLIQFDDTHWPHITVVQSFINEKKLSKLYKSLEGIASNARPLNIEITDIENENNTAGLFIPLTRELQQLHDECIRVSKPFVVDWDKNAFILDAGEKLTPGTLDWVKNFRTQKTYHPHISLALDPKEIPKIKPKKFTVNEFAVFQLGNYCTCRKLLKKWKLN